MTIQAAPLSAYSAKDQAFFRFWYGHMRDDIMQPPLDGICHSAARYVWDAALREGSEPKVETEGLGAKPAEPGAEGTRPEHGTQSGKETL